MGTMLNCQLALMKQQQALQAMEKYNNSFAQDNISRVVRMYTQAINGAQTAQEAQGYATQLESFLVANGQGMNDVQGINNPLINAGQAAGHAAAGTKGTAQDKAVCKDLNEEMKKFGLKGDDKKDWAEFAKANPDKVRVLGKDGQPQNDGKVSMGDILEVKSEKYGTVKIQVGGDGQINGGDDKVISMGGQAAANGLFAGVNQINNPAGQQQLGNLAGLMQPNNLFGAQNAFGIDATGDKPMFNEQEIKNLVAAILYNSMGNQE